MSWRPPIRTWSWTVSVVVVIATLAAAAAEKPAVGRAAGTFTVDGKPFAFAYAYAQVEPSRDGDDVLWVLLTEKPASADQLAGRFRDTAASDQLNALAFALDAQNEPSDWRWSHPALSIGCALCSDLKFQVSSRTREEIGGAVFSAKTQTFQNQTYAFRVSFAARIARPAEPAGATKAQQAAVRELRRRGLAFRPADLYLFRTEPEVIRLFLDAGMKPDTLAPGATETLLLDVLASDCSEPQVRSAALMLIAAGADPNYRNPDGGLPVLRAYGCADILDALLKAGANLALPGSVPGKTAGRELIDSAITFEHADVVRLLIARGYDVKRDGARLLEQARNRPEIQQILRAAGAGTPDQAGRTPPAKPAPKTAVTTRTPEQARQELGRRKLALTEDRFWDRLVEFDTEATLLYLEAGISPNARRQPPQNDTPLLFVTQSGCGAPDTARQAAAAEIALALIARKADVGARSENETTPLLHAAESCPTAVVRALLAAGASTGARARGGATAMLLAVLADREENVRALIDGGYDVKAELPELLPLASGKPGIEALLKQAAAGKPGR